MAVRERERLSHGTKMERNRGRRHLKLSLGILMCKDPGFSVNSTVCVLPRMRDFMATLEVFTAIA